MLETVTIDNYFVQVKLHDTTNLRKSDRSEWSTVWEFHTLMDSARHNLDRWLSVPDFRDNAHHQIAAINKHISNGLITAITQNIYI